MYRKIISLILVFAMLFCGLSISAFADYSQVPLTMWDKLMLDYSNHYDDAAITSFFHDLITVPLTTDNVCSNSSDNLHHAQNSLSVGHDSNGTYLNCQCQYCNDTFKYYSDELEDAYSHYTGSFGCNNGVRLNNDGFYYRYLNVNDINSFPGGNIYMNGNSIVNSVTGTARYYYFELPSNYLNITFLTSYSFDLIEYTNDDEYPYHGNLIIRSRTTVSPTAYYIDLNVTAGKNLKVITIAPMLFKFKTTEQILGNVPNNITQNIQNVYQGNNDYSNIVNTTTNKFYNPTTNQYIDMSTYNYDYSTRTYNIVLADDNSTEVNVEYGAENITVQIADTINNYYYGYSDCPEEPSHNHEWTPTIVNTRTCTQSGITTYTCESCGQAYTDVVPATGHIWDNGVLTPAVLDDDTGEIITPAFYTFTCEICGETETSEAATPPSSGITETNDLWWERLLQWLEDFKNSLFNKLDNLGSSDDDAIDIEIEGDEFTFNDGENSFSFKDDFLAKFGIFGDLWEVGQYVVNIVSQDAAYAYDFDINEALSIEGGTP